MILCHLPKEKTRLRWGSLYQEAELYKAAVRLYTKPLFQWRKALSSSSDGNTLYEFARRGLRNMESLHRSLAAQSFHFRPGLALHHNFNGKKRTIYLFPWEERLVDLLLYRLLSRRMDSWFSPFSYAYRHFGKGIDCCQRRVAHAIASAGEQVFVVKRDIEDYFGAIDHTLLLAQLEEFVDGDDYLFRLLSERIHFRFLEGGTLHGAERGIPFGAAIACFFANVFLTPLDRSVASVPEVSYFRYADDLLLLSSRREAVVEAERRLAEGLKSLCLKSKQTHAHDLLLSTSPRRDVQFLAASGFRHLGLEFRAGGTVGLSRDKCRKICNLFRYAFRRKKGRFRKIKDPAARARLAIEIVQKTLEQGIRNIAIIDYYLRHTEDEEQIRLLDRWLAEEVLSWAFGGGHRKGYFRKLSFHKLREMGLCSLVHRRRLLLHGHAESTFFLWKNYQEQKKNKANSSSWKRDSGERRPGAPGDLDSSGTFSPCPEAAVASTLVREKDCL